MREKERHQGKRFTEREKKETEELNREIEGDTGGETESNSICRHVRNDMRKVNHAHARRAQ